MPSKKITALTEATTMDALDVICVVDVDDTTQSASGTNKKITKTNLITTLGVGSGDVVGPGSAVDSNFAAFDTTTGKLIKDSGNAAGDFATAAQGTTADSALQNIVEDTTPQLGGELDLNGNSVGGDSQTATGDGTTTIDWKLGNTFDFQFGAFNETFTFTAPTKPGVFILKLVQDSVGSRTATWPGTVKWTGGAAPTLTTTATTGTDIITFYYDGTSYFAVQSLDFS